MRDGELTGQARRSRQSPTEPEHGLWLELRAKRFSDIKFRRQKVIGPYIVDFAARVPMLVIEIDGDSHATQEAYYRRRETYLPGQGYQVIRFTNSDVMANMAGVLQTIESVAGAAQPPLPTLSPEGERAK